MWLPTDAATARMPGTTPGPVSTESRATSTTGYTQAYWPRCGRSSDDGGGRSLLGRDSVSAQSRHRGLRNRGITGPSVGGWDCSSRAPDNRPALMSQELAALAADPERVAEVPPEALPALIGEVEGLKAALYGRLTATSIPATPAAPQGSCHCGGTDALLTATEVADRLGVAKRWVYAHASELPFARRLGEGTLRFDPRGLDRWLKTRRF